MPGFSDLLTSPKVGQRLDPKFPSHGGVRKTTQTKQDEAHMRMTGRVFSHQSRQTLSVGSGKAQNPSPGARFLRFPRLVKLAPSSRTVNSGVSEVAASKRGEARRGLFRLASPHGKTRCFMRFSCPGLWEMESTSVIQQKGPNPKD